jgi:hypothetical protein
VGNAEAAQTPREGPDRASVAPTWQSGSTLLVALGRLGSSASATMTYRRAPRPRPLPRCGSCALRLLRAPFAAEHIPQRGHRRRAPRQLRVRLAHAPAAGIELALRNLAFFKNHAQ